MGVAAGPAPASRAAEASTEYALKETAAPACSAVKEAMRAAAAAASAARAALARKIIGPHKIHVKGRHSRNSQGPCSRSNSAASRSSTRADAAPSASSASFPEAAPGCLCSSARRTEECSWGQKTAWHLTPASSAPHAAAASAAYFCTPELAAPQGARPLPQLPLRRLRLPRVAAAWHAAVAGVAFSRAAPRHLAAIPLPRATAEAHLATPP
ncbi:60S ribosomal protein L22-like [Cyclospora cayetanensis]|uniref:60S ribosomal protein L22-like n=1 Tax=Cyclospora cayetanensis TaxID=88456 RepID=A0A6P6RU07_9EIME|nr:60S ribosomal protein L22-like [Cyclospora cayetanensis]